MALIAVLLNPGCNDNLISVIICQNLVLTKFYKIIFEICVKKIKIHKK